MQHVPCPPECVHFLQVTQRDTDICVHGRETASDQNIVLAKMLNHILSWIKVFIITKLACESIGLSARAMA